MVYSLVCIGPGGSVLLRISSGVAAPSFPSAGLLAAVYATARHHEYMLSRVNTDDSCIYFRLFHEVILVVLVTTETNLNSEVVSDWLHRLFDALVFHVGRKELLSMQNPEILKRQLRGVSSTVHSILDEDGGFGVRSGMVEIWSDVCPDVLRQMFLRVVRSADTIYGCLLVRGRLVESTPNWWDLKPVERYLVVLHVSLSPYAMLRDSPIYLPCTNPDTANRLVFVRVSRHISILLICGADPSLESISNICESVFGDENADRMEEVRDLFNQLSRIDPRPKIKGENITEDIVLAYLVLNKQNSCFLPYSARLPSSCTGANVIMQQLVSFALSCLPHGEGVTMASEQDLNTKCVSAFALGNDCSFVCVTRGQLTAYMAIARVLPWQGLVQFVDRHLSRFSEHWSLLRG